MSSHFSEIVIELNRMISFFPSFRKINTHFIIVKACVSKMYFIMMSCNEGCNPSIRWVLLLFEADSTIIRLFLLVRLVVGVILEHVRSIDEYFHRNATEVSIHSTYTMESKSSNLSSVIAEGTMTRPVGKIILAPCVIVEWLIWRNPRSLSHAC